MINGVICEPLKQIADDRGKVMHMLRSDSPLFSRFGEVYFSVINAGVVKAWKKHAKMTQYLAVPVGKIKIVIYDDRKDSSSYKTIETISAGEDDYKLIIIPPLLWYGFKGVSKKPSLIANCADMPHQSDEIKRLDHDTAIIPFNWTDLT